MALVSMTGFADAQGALDNVRWRWEVKSVNGRSLDLRLRLPPGFESMEPAARKLAGDRFRRGNIQASLTLEPGEGARSLKVDPVALDRAIAEAIGEAQTQPTDAPPHMAALTAEQQDMERRLIGKLHLAGQLKPGYLLRALRERKLSLFEAALCALGDYNHLLVRAAMEADQSDALALACAGVGVDRSAFMTMLGLVRDLNGAMPRGDLDRARRVFDTFGPDRAKFAAAEFRNTIAAQDTNAGD